MRNLLILSAVFLLVSCAEDEGTVSALGVPFVNVSEIDTEDTYILESGTVTAQYCPEAVRVSGECPEYLYDIEDFVGAEFNFHSLVASGMAWDFIGGCGSEGLFFHQKDGVEDTRCELNILVDDGQEMSGESVTFRIANAIQYSNPRINHKMSIADGSLFLITGMQNPDNSTQYKFELYFKKKN